MYINHLCISVAYIYIYIINEPVKPTRVSFHTHVTHWDPYPHTTVPIPMNVGTGFTQVQALVEAE
jgi:hypothetical protein